MTASFFYPACCGIITDSRRRSDILSNQSHEDQVKNAAGGSFIERLPARTWSEGNRSSRARAQEPRAAVLSMAARRDDAQGWRKSENADRMPRSSSVLPGCQPEVNNCGFESRSKSQAQPGQDRPMLTDRTRTTKLCGPRSLLRREASKMCRRRAINATGNRAEHAQKGVRAGVSPRRTAQSARHQLALSLSPSSTRASEPRTSYPVARRGLRASYVLGRAAVRISFTPKEPI